MKTEINIGDTVQIKNIGNHYSTYTSKFKEMGFKNPDKNRFLLFDDDYKKKKLKETIFTVFAISTHELNSKWILIGIKDNNNGNQFLFGKSGLKLFEDEFSFTKEPFLKNKMKQKIKKK